MKLTLSTMYNFCPDLFDDMKIPEGLDKETLIQNLIMDSGEFGVLYLDGDYFKSILGWWSAKELPIWERLYNTELLKYNPLDNYDRYEDGERTVKGKDTSSETSFDSYDLQTTNGNENSGAETFKSHVHGNIGVTTSQKMIEEERRVAEFNTYAYIIKSFTNKFCIEIY